METDFTEAEIEASRQRLRIPAGWVWSGCQAGCGDLVWHPAGQNGTIVCSARCALNFIAQWDRPS